MAGLSSGSQHQAARYAAVTVSGARKSAGSGVSRGSGPGSLGPADDSTESSVADAAAPLLLLLRAVAEDGRRRLALLKLEVVEVGAGGVVVTVWVTTVPWSAVDGCEVGLVVRDGKAGSVDAVLDDSIVDTAEVALGVLVTVAAGVDG